MAKLTTLNCPKCFKDFSMLHFCSKELTITYSNISKSLSIIFTDLTTNVDTVYKFSVSKKKVQEKLNQVINSQLKNLIFI